jgi:hypothetical protein
MEGKCNDSSNDQGCYPSESMVHFGLDLEVKCRLSLWEGDVIAASTSLTGVGQD